MYNLNEELEMVNDAMIGCETATDVASEFLKFLNDSGYILKDSDIIDITEKLNTIREWLFKLKYEFVEIEKCNEMIGVVDGLLIDFKKLRN